MKNRAFSVAIGQICLSDKGSVHQQIVETFRRADESESELVILPEFVAHSDHLALDGIIYLQVDDEAMRAARHWALHSVSEGEIIDLARHHKKAVAFGSLHQDKAALTSRCVYFDPVREVEHVYDKTHVHWTERFLRPGNALSPVETRFGRLGFLICYDTAFTEAARTLGLQGADMLVTLAATPKDFDWRYVHRRLSGMAINNQCYVLGSHLGHTADVPMGGRSVIFDPHGASLGMIDHDDPGVLSARIDYELQEKWRDAEQNLPFRRPALYAPLVK